MAFGHRVRDKRKERKYSQQELADMIGVNQPVIGSLEARDSTSSKHASKIAKVLKVSLDWLLTGEGEESDLGITDSSDILKAGVGVDFYDADDDLMPDEIEFPMYETVEVSAGNGAVAQEVIASNERLRLPRTLLERLNVTKNKVVGAKLRGDSLHGLIQDGATIAIDLSKASCPIRDNKIYVIQVGGDFKAKILQRSLDNSSVIIKSTNPSYSDVTMLNEDFARDVCLVGWVFWWSNFERW